MSLRLLLHALNEEFLVPLITIQLCIQEQKTDKIYHVYCTTHFTICFFQKNLNIFT